MSGFLNSIGYANHLLQVPADASSAPPSTSPIVPINVVPSTVTLRTLSRLRAPKRSPINTPASQSGYFEPLPSPGTEITGAFPSPGEPKPLYLCQPFVKAALVKGSFKTIVAPPKYVDMNEWVAINRECGLGARGE